MTGLIPAAMLGGVPAAVFEVLNSGAFAAEESDKQSRIFVTGDRKTWTFSLWVKRSNLSATAGLLTTIGPGGFGIEGAIAFTTGDAIDWIFDYNGGARWRLVTDKVFRDVAEWYHLLFVADTTDATSADRLKMFVNGTRITSFTTENQPSSSANGTINYAATHYIGSNNAGTGAYCDGYLAEVNFIDGQALTPEDFAEEDSVTGQWNPIEYAGTYGTTGFYLEFQNGADLGEDSSGNTNDFTNSGVIQSTDTPTDNHCTMNILKSPNGTTIEDTGLNVIVTSAGNGSTFATMAVSSGKWYWEVLINITTTATILGVAKPENSTALFLIEAGAYSYYGSTGNKYIDGAAAAAYGATYGATDIIGVELDMDSGTLEFFKNGTSQGVATSALSGLTLQPAVSDGSLATAIDVTLGFTEDSWTYTPTSGFLALSTKNLATPDIITPPDYFKSIVYDDGTGAKTVGFQPDLVWMKSRGSAFNHKLVDSVRGATKALSSDDTTAEVTDSTGLTSFDANGFTVGADTDYSDTTGTGMAAWSWKEGVTPGFDIVSYTGDGSAGRTFAHSLGVAPETIFIKGTSFAQNWIVGHKDMDSTSPWDYAMFLDLNNAKTNNILYWNDTAPSSAVVTIGSGNGVNSNTEDYIAYLFASIEGFSKIGSYIGNGSADGPFVYCGFRPAFLLVKRADVANNWVLQDISRSPNNVIDNSLFPDLTNVEDAASTIVNDVLSNGFKVRHAVSVYNASGGTYIFMAFAESPFQYSRAR